jgi:dolichol-phosphate mannosyltransferase
MSTLVVIPTYNERDSLPTLIREIMRLDGFDVLVVDDDSPDGTGKVADGLAAEFPGRVEVLHRTGPRGFGRSYVDAFARAVQGSHEFVCQMDADLSHDPKYLPDLVSAGAGSLDVVVGSRYLHGVSVVNWPLRRLALSTFANAYVRTVTRLRVRDCTSGFRCWRRAALEAVAPEPFHSDGYSFLVEMLFEAQRRGLRIGEVPIVFVERRVGSSKMSRRVILESAMTPWRLVLRSAFRR